MDRLTVRRRSYLALLPLGVLSGCTGGPGDAITSLAVNRDDVSHTVAVSVVRDDRRVIDGDVEVAAEDVAEVGSAPWRPGRYRVMARVDGEPALDRSFRTEEPFNQLDVVIDDDGEAELNRGLAA
ncbi:hypothetical protein [Haloplanus salilacus]|uniref:hypothetical protein n=1 Tax=Haloplanus salilacus TaxID=2949994 RepID=UPI0030D34CFD